MNFFGLLLSTLHYFLVFFCEMSKVGLLKDVKRQIGAIIKLILTISCIFIDEVYFCFVHRSSQNAKYVAVRSSMIATYIPVLLLIVSKKENLIRHTCMAQYKAKCNINKTI